MSLDAIVEFNREAAAIGELHFAAARRLDRALGALEALRDELAELERALDAACARYVDRFDRDGDGKVTPVEVLKAAFSDARPRALPHEDPSPIVRAMFAVGADGDAVVDLAEFTRAVRAHVLGPAPDPDPGTTSASAADPSPSAACPDPSAADPDPGTTSAADPDPDPGTTSAAGPRPRH